MLYKNENLANQCFKKGHGKFKQKTNQERTPGACFASTLVCLQLLVNLRGKSNILYENPHMGSAYGCRPLRLWFVDETKEHALSEIKRLKDEARNLVPFINGGIKVIFTVFMSMCDQKIENFKWGNLSSMRCPFCRALQREFHNSFDFLADPEAIGDLCMSILHFLLRFVDHFLKVLLSPYAVLQN